MRASAGNTENVAPAEITRIGRYSHHRPTFVCDIDSSMIRLHDAYMIIRVWTNKHYFSLKKCLLSNNFIKISENKQKFFEIGGNYLAISQIFPS